MNCLSKNSPTGRASAGKMWTQKLSIRFSRSMIKKRGMVTAMGTNIRAMVLTVNKMVLSLNRFLQGWKWLL